MIICLKSFSNLFHLAVNFRFIFFFLKMGNSEPELPIYFENYVIFKALHRFKHHLV